ncbi:hypothetical protein [Halpernia frigidisoli]|uniref:DUF4129 domain-containing protein n=1 Tax=Halpernia frigidisoli TaxID=1125876 RepID=A0A1I3J5V6_9FLAO|nr:hypothetical protein [Halpernia frigidisoli]SFI55617.1 protein of unknown function [Halpernia frigidisoli]
MKFKLIFLIFFIIISRTSAQEGTLPPPQSKILDTLQQAKEEMFPADSLLQGNYATENPVEQKNFEQNFQKKYNSNEFDYQILKPHESLWDKIKRSVGNLLRKIFGNLDPSSANRYTLNFLRLLGIIGLAFLIYFLLKYLNSKNGHFFFGRKNKKLAPKSSEIHENIHEINFPELINKFEAEKDFRSAIRYRFLSVLKMLSDKNKILWMPEKTNQDYVSELKDETSKKQFLELAYIFDYVWYGEFSITESDYSFYKEKFKNSKF